MPTTRYAAPNSCQEGEEDNDDIENRRHMAKITEAETQVSDKDFMTELANLPRQQQRLIKRILQTRLIPPNETTNLSIL